MPRHMMHYQGHLSLLLHRNKWSCIVRCGDLRGGRLAIEGGALLGLAAGRANERIHPLWRQLLAVLSA